MRDNFWCDENKKLHDKCVGCPDLFTKVNHDNVTYYRCNRLRIGFVYTIPSTPYNFIERMESLSRRAKNG